MRTLALDRLHYSARREVGRDTDLQMDVVRPNVPFENLDVRILLELQRQELPLLARQRPLQRWERPWDVTP